MSLITKPYIDPLIQSKLTELGGLVPSGPFAGQPKIKIVWGPDEEIFSRGKMRPRFVELSGGKWIYKRWFMSPELFAELTHWVTQEMPKYPNPAQPLKLRSFFEKANSLEYIELHDSDDPTSDTIGPEGWIYMSDLDAFKETVQPYWFVVQWVNTDQITDTEESWNAARYAAAWIPEIRKTAFIDELGPWPSGGLYQHIILRLFDEDDAGNKTRIDPTFETVVVPVQQMIKARDAQTEHERSKDERTKRVFNELDAAAKSKRSKEWQVYDDACHDAIPAFDEASAWVPVATPKVESKKEGN